MKEKFNKVALNHLKNQMIKELTEMSNKSIEKDLIKSLISSKSVTIQLQFKHLTQKKKKIH